MTLDTATIAEHAEALSKRLSAEARVRSHEPMAKRTTLRVGGPADIFVEPGNEVDLAKCFGFAAEQNLPVFVLGRGSNLLVRDGGVRGLVISLGQAWFSRVESDGSRIRAGAGARLRSVAMEARRCSLAGMEFMEGIPGSVGGALRMNAGAMGGATFDVLESMRVMDRAGNTRDLRRAEIPVSYRSCPLLETDVALEACFLGKPEPREKIEERMRAYNEKRWGSQPAAPSAGCIFKNPLTVPAGKLVDELGLKGTRVGAARVSLEHGNFIVNDGGATAADVLKLVEIIRERARHERGIELHTEVEVIGE